jgi:two-component system response regulator YesN
VKTILFLDDEAPILKTYERLIRQFDVKAYYAQNTVQAKSILNCQKIDLIISDYRLEQETGLEFLTEMRKELKNIPMIILSGYAEENFIREAIHSQTIQEYLLKPISLNEFKSLIQKYTEPVEESA